MGLIFNKVVEKVPSRFRLANVDQVRVKREMVDEFKDMSLHKGLLQALEEMKITRPTPIQSMAIPKLVSSKKIRAVISAETGSGKTLSYLLPLFHRLKTEEKDADGVKSWKLRAAILVPTNELVDQVHAVCKLISHNVKLRVGKLGHQQGRQAAGPCDLIVGTPRKFLAYPEMSRIRHLVVDEADTVMCDAGFTSEVDKIMARVPSIDMHVYCSATLTTALSAYLKPLADVSYFATKGLHLPVPHVPHSVKVVRLPEAGRFAFIARLVNPAEKTMVFCDSAQTVQKLHRHLTDNHDHLAPMMLHGNIPERQRAALLATFRSDDRANLLVCTDLLARGIDLPVVRHVVLNGCPRSATDYLHRVGRVGRAGAPGGRVTSVIAGRQVHFVRRIEAILKKPLLRLRNQKNPYLRSRTKSMKGGPRPRNPAGKPGVARKSPAKPSAARTLGTPTVARTSFRETNRDRMGRTRNEEPETNPVSERRRFTGMPHNTGNKAFVGAKGKSFRREPRHQAGSMQPGPSASKRKLARKTRVPE